MIFIFCNTFFTFIVLWKKIFYTFSKANPTATHFEAVSVLKCPSLVHQNDVRIDISRWKKDVEKNCEYKNTNHSEKCHFNCDTDTFEVIKLLCTCAYVKRKFVNAESMHQHLTGRKINEKLKNLGELSGIHSGDIKC